MENKNPKPTNHSPLSTQIADNDMFGSEARMHAFSAIGRALWRLAPSALRALHRAGWSPAIAFGTARAVRAVLIAARSIAA